MRVSLGQAYVAGVHPSRGLARGLARVDSPERCQRFLRDTPIDYEWNRPWWMSEQCVEIR